MVLKINEKQGPSYASNKPVNLSITGLPIFLNPKTLKDPCSFLTFSSFSLQKVKIAPKIPHMYPIIAKATNSGMENVSTPRSIFSVGLNKTFFFWNYFG